MKYFLTLIATFFAVGVLAQEPAPEPEPECVETPENPCPAPEPE